LARTFYLNLKQDSLCSVWRPVSPKARPLRLAKIHLMHNRQSIFQLRSRELLNLKSCLRISSVSSVSMCPLLTMYEGEDLIPPSFTLLYPAIHHPGRPRPLSTALSGLFLQLASHHKTFSSRKTKMPSDGLQRHCVVHPLPRIVLRGCFLNSAAAKMMYRVAARAFTNLTFQIHDIL